MQEKLPKFQIASLIRSVYLEVFFFFYFVFMFMGGKMSKDLVVSFACRV